MHLLKKTYLDIMAAVRLGVIAGICFFLGKQVAAIFSTIPPVVGGLWTVISGILVLREAKEETFIATYERIVSSLIGVASSAFALIFFPESFFVIVLSVVIASLISLLFQRKKYEANASLTAAVVTIIWFLSDQSHPILFAGTRFFESFLGCAICFGISSIPLSKEEK